jgi:DNA mismatch repair ATPase MutS
VRGTPAKRARQLLGELAVHHVAQSRSSRQKRADESQMDLFVDPKLEVAKAIAGTDPDQLTPIQALALVQEWKKKLTP